METINPQTRSPTKATNAVQDDRHEERPTGAHALAKRVKTEMAHHSAVAPVFSLDVSSVQQWPKLWSLLHRRGMPLGEEQEVAASCGKRR